MVSAEVRFWSSFLFKWDLPGGDGSYAYGHLTLKQKLNKWWENLLTVVSGLISIGNCLNYNLFFFLWPLDSLNKAFWWSDDCIHLPHFFVFVLFFFTWTVCLAAIVSSVGHPQTTIPWRLLLSCFSRVRPVTIISASVLFCWAGSWMGPGVPANWNRPRDEERLGSRWSTGRWSNFRIQRTWARSINQKSRQPEVWKT